jgi:2-phosphosulfolactate phosphatase
MFADMEWGEHGAASVSETTVIIDVLSFSTSCTLAVEHGIAVYPFPHTDLAQSFGRATGIEVAGKRRDLSARYTLSPASFTKPAETERLILPSPNGSRLSLLAMGNSILIGCLLNAQAVAASLTARGGDVMLVPAGERWPDDTIRFALEDYLGAGAILQHLACDKSPEAMVCEAAFSAVQNRLLETLLDCRSGQELIGRGYRSDVEIAAHLNSAQTVPKLSQKNQFYSDWFGSTPETLFARPVAFYTNLGVP